MIEKITGRCWLLGDNIDTDQMAPGSSMSYEWEERKLTMFPQRQDIIENATNGDLLVGGENFGCGSSREQAVENLQLLGVKAVVAESFARIFFRNAIARALPVIICPGITNVTNEGDKLSINWNDFSVTNSRSKEVLNGVEYDSTMRSIIEHGGLLNVLKQKLDADQINLNNLPS